MLWPKASPLDLYFRLCAWAKLFNIMLPQHLWSLQITINCLNNWGTIGFKSFLFLLYLFLDSKQYNHSYIIVFFCLSLLINLGYCFVWPPPHLLIHMTMSIIKFLFNLSFSPNSNLVVDKLENSFKILFISFYEEDFQKGSEQGT